MTERIGFDRIVERDWLDVIASQLAAHCDATAAFYATRDLVARSVGGGVSHHNASGKTMTVLARVWLKVPTQHQGLRDRGLALLPSIGPEDRLALHWAMCELGFPFFLDAAAIAGRMLAVGDSVLLTSFRARLSERWGARGTMPQASQRLLRTWARWGVLAETDQRGRYQRTCLHAVEERTAALVAEARVASVTSGSLDLGDLQRASDLFPFVLPDLRETLRRSEHLQLARHGSHGWVVRAAEVPA